jgi:signal transduction histidine kinase/ActR/RegA family two-component response regulator
LPGAGDYRSRVGFFASAFGNAMEQHASQPDEPSLPHRVVRAVEAAGHGVWEWDRRTGTAWYSQRVRELLGLRDQELPERIDAFFARVHPEDLERAHDVMVREATDRPLFEVALRVRHADGSWLGLRLRGRARAGVDGSARMHGTLTPVDAGERTVRDASATSDRLASALDDQSRLARELEQARQDLMRQNAALEQARAAAEAARESTRMFLANMSHEMRTPMMAVGNAIEVLLDEATDPEERRRMQRIVRLNGEHLRNIIDNLLTISKMEAGAMVVESLPVDLLKLVREAVVTMEPEAVKKRLELRMKLGSAVPRTVRSDPMALRMILLNLLGNATKFTSHGGIRVLVRVTEEPPTPRLDPEDGDPPMATRRLQVSVTDTGIGMTPQQMRQLFRPFRQADASTTRKFGGTGLGLSLSRRLARMLGGDLTVRSELERGSTFTLEVGLGAAPDAEFTDQLPADTLGGAPAVRPEPSAHGSGLRVLLAEDSDDNRRLIEHHLTRAGMRVVVACNGVEAVDLAMASLRQGEPFEAILMDMQMPEMDGYEATRRLRKEGWLGPIAALTAHAMSGDRRTCMQAGCSHYLTKPIEREQLLRLVREMVEGGQTGA